jgi:hypothetical protein
MDRNNNNDDDDYYDDDGDDDDEKMEFEKEREKILNDLPASVKSMFGQIGFKVMDDGDDDDSDESDDDDDDTKTKKNKKKPAAVQYQQHQQQQTFVPVLIVSPYDVPPKPIRDVYWFDMYSRGKRTKTLSTLPYLIYHYGSMGSKDPTDCYSFLNNNEFIFYNEGVSLGYDTIPIPIRTKMEQNLPLTSFEQMLVRGLSEMKEDCQKSPSERKRGMIFQERHEEQQSPQQQQQSQNGSNKKHPPIKAASKSKKPPAKSSTTAVKKPKANKAPSSSSVLDTTTNAATATTTTTKRQRKK